MKKSLGKLWLLCVTFAVCLCLGLGSAGLVFAQDFSIAQKGAAGSDEMDEDVGASDVVIGDYAYKGAEQSVLLQPGVYKLETWGGSGGGGSGVSTQGSAADPNAVDNTVYAYTEPISGTVRSFTRQQWAADRGNTSWIAAGSRGGAGGYSTGVLTLTAATTVYIYVGGAGTYYSTIDGAGGWNGGGATWGASSGSGGGGTDIRIGGNTLNHRILVAGGGGGADNPGGNRGPATIGGSDDGSGGAGGGTEGEKAVCDGVFSTVTTGIYANARLAATQTGGAAFGSGQKPTNQTDTGGGGGGWYGGYASNHNNGGAGGGSGYTLTAASARPSGYAHAANSPYNLGSPFMIGGIWSGNGKAKITQLNKPPVQSAVPTFNFGRSSVAAGANTINLLKSAGGTNLGITDEDSTVVSIATTGISTVKGSMTAATSFLNYTANAGNSSFTVSPKVYWTGTKSFYLCVKDSANNIIWVQMNMTCSNDVMAVGAGSTTGAYSYVATHPNNPLGANRRTVFVSKPLRKGAEYNLTVKAAELFTDADTTFDQVLITNKSITTHSYFDVTSSATLLSRGSESITIATNGKPAGSAYFAVTLTVSSVEKTTTTVIENQTVDVVFKIDNTRPYFVEDTAMGTAKAGPAATVAVGGSKTFNISDFCTDPDGNTLTILGWKLADKEFYSVDKYGYTRAPATGITAHYNVGSITEGDTSATSAYATGFSTTATGFEPNSLVNASGGDTTQAYASIAFTGSSITVTGLHATRSQYKAGRAKPGLGHLYFLVQVKDGGEESDTGIFFPIALTVTDSATDKLSVMPSLEDSTSGDTRSNNIKIFSPMGIGTTVGDWTNVASAADQKPALAADKDNFTTRLGALTESDPKHLWAQNEFLFLANTTNNKNLVNSVTTGDYQFKEFFKISLIELYASADTVSKFTAEEISRLSGTLDSTMAKAFEYTTIGGKSLIKFYGIKIETLRSTQGKFLQFSVDLMSSRASSNKSFDVQVKANNVTPMHRLGDDFNRIEGINNAPLGSVRNDVTVEYSIYNGQTFWITPYDLMMDGDTFSGINNGIVNGKRVYNSNPKTLAPIAEYTQLVKDVNKTFAVKTSTTAGGAATADTMTLDRFSFSNMPSFTNNYGTVSALSSTNERFDSVQVSANARTLASQPITFTVDVLDSEAVRTTIRVNVHVLNSAPYLRNEAKTVFYLMASNGLNSSDFDVVGSIDTPPVFDNSPTVGAYNVREFLPTELLTDNDRSDLVNGFVDIVTASVQVGTKDNNGNFVAFTAAEGEKYATISFGTGTGRRSVYSRVMRIEGKSSTQGLKNGFFIKFTATDTYDNVDYTIQFEIMNSAPTLNESAFQYIDVDEGGAVGKAWTWQYDGINEQDNKSTKYLASDAEVLANAKTATGVSIPISAKAGKVLVTDADVQQHVMLSAFNPAMVPAAYAMKVSGYDGNSVAAWYSNPYNDGTVPEQGDVVVRYYDRTNNYRLVASPVAADIDKYAWMIEITPRSTNMNNGLDLTFAIRSTNQTGAAGSSGDTVGGDTRGAKISYQGARPGTLVAVDDKASGENRKTFTIKLLLSTKGLTNNHEFYKTNDAHNGEHFAYKTDASGNITEKKYASNPAQTVYYTDLVNGISVNGQTLNRAIPNSKPVYLPISYFAMQTGYQKTQSDKRVRFDSGFLTNTVDIFNSISLYDGETTWTGSALNTNPYITFGLATSENFTTKRDFVDPNNREVWSDADSQYTATVPFEEDNLGFSMQKRKTDGGVRTDKPLTLNVKLASYSGTVKDPKSTVDVSLKVETDNDPLVVNDDATNKAETNIKTFVGDNPTVVALISEASDKTPYESNVGVNKKFVWYSDADRIQYTQKVPGATPGTEETKNVLKKDFAYFMASSRGGDFTAAELAVLKNALREKKFPSEARSQKYFGALNGDTLDSSFTANKLYELFFTVEPGTDSRSITIRPNKKTELNWYKTDGSKMTVAEYTAFAAQFGLVYDAAANETYYPLKLLVYDDFNGTGIAKADFDVVEFRVRIGNDAIKINPSANAGTDPVTGLPSYRVSLMQGASTSINVTDIVYDGDFKTSGNHFMTKAEIEGMTIPSGSTMTAEELALTKATTDYLPANSVNKAYAQPGQDANVSLDWDTDYFKLTIKALKRDMRNPVAARITVSFVDNVSLTPAKIVFIVEVANKLPDINNEADNNYRTINMRSGDYFTLVATSFKEFRYGSTESTTPVDSDSWAKFNGSRASKSEDATYGAKAWTYNDSFDSTYLIGKKLVTSVPVGTPNNYDMGYLALANDDTPWALRISDVSIGAQGTGKIAKIALNRISPDGTNDLEIATAYRFEANGACDNVPITVTLRDEKKESTTSFTFRVSVISTLPKYIENDSSPDVNKRLGGFSANRKPDNSYNTASDRPLNYDGEFSADLNKYVYKTTMTVGEKRTFSVQDFAYDIDTNDSANMYLNREYFGNPFKIVTDGNTITSGQMYTDYFDFTDTGKAFTITCKNFHNGGVSAPNYDVLYFRIMDPSAKTAADGIEVQLRVYTKTKDMDAVSASASDKTVKSRYEYLYNKNEAGKSEPTVIRLVGKDKAAGGLFTDVDFGAKNIRYSVSVFYLKDLDQNRFLALSELERDALRIGDFAVGGSTSYVPAPDSENTRLFYKYFESIEFNEDGSTVSLVPKTATAPLSTGKLPVIFEVTKKISRDDVVLSPKYSAVNLAVKNSAPMAVGNTTSNYDNKLRDLAGTPTKVETDVKRPFLTCEGTKSSSFEFWVYDSTPTAEAVKNDQILFYDLDTQGETFDKNNKVTLSRGSLKVKTEGIYTEYYDDDGNLKKTLVDSSNSLYAEALNAIRMESGTAGEREWIKFTMLKKIVDERYPTRPLNVVYTVSGTDKSGASVTTEFVMVFVNSKPTFNLPAASLTVPYKMSQLGDGSFLMKMSLEKGKTGITVNLADIITDSDFSTVAENNTESFKFVNDGTPASQNLSQISGDSSKLMEIENAFTARVVTGNNLQLYFTATSFERGKTSTVFLTVEDSAGARTSLLTIELTIANTGATAINAMNKEYFSEGSESKEYDIIKLITDPNPEDMLSADDPKSTTFHTITSIEMGKYDGADNSAGGVKDLVECIALGDGQKFYIKPLPGLVGQQPITIRVKDDGGMGAEGAIVCEIKFTVYVSKNASSLKANDVSVYYKRDHLLDCEEIFYNHETQQSDGSSYYIDSVGTPDNSNVLIVEEAGEKVGDPSKFYVHGNKQASDTNPVSAGLTIYIKVIGSETDEATPIPIKVNVKENKAPVFNQYNKYTADKEFLYSRDNMTNGIITIPVTEIFADHESDDMVFVSAKSQKSVVVDASINLQDNTLLLKFKGKGTSKITIEVKDAVGVPYTMTYIAQNIDLPELNFFVNAVGHMQENPLLYIVIASAVVLFLIILIAIIAAVRKKKRMREEIEALLVSEMELEEQMLKLAASPSPTFYQSYGYLPPTQNVQNSNFMLGEGHNMQSNSAIGLNPGGSDKNPQNPANGFDEADL